ncbi:MAG: hypothetical protein MRY64_14545 [Hyphomonadaceae bacterium]|nr:hypothetical protein [Hyphomonadaceae bacterium]
MYQRFILIGLFVLSGCGSLSGIANQADLGRGIDEDALIMNDAQSRATNGMIVLNILRARDNWPTTYTTLSGVTNQPKRSLASELNLSPLGLGNPPGPFQSTSLKTTGSAGADAIYKVNPVIEGNGPQGLFQNSFTAQLFAGYWDAGWPREVLIPLFISEVSVGAKDSDTKCLIDGDAPSNDDLACDVFAGKDSALFDDIGFEKPQPPQVDPTDLVCSRLPSELRELLLVESSENLQSRMKTLESEFSGQFKLSASAGASSSLQICMPKNPADSRGEKPHAYFTHGLYTYTDIRFRSFNDMIYFLGETLRGKETFDYLFKVFEAEKVTSDLQYAAGVTHAEVDYVALPSCPLEYNSEPCTEDDRTGTVLSLLSQIYLFSQSKELLAAPNVVFAER